MCSDVYYYIFKENKVNSIVKLYFNKVLLPVLLNLMQLGLLSYVF